MTDPTSRMAADSDACGDAVVKAIDPLLTTYDGRIVFATVLAEASYIGAMLRASGAYQPATIARLFSEAMNVALTMDIKPKVLYTDGTDQLGRKQ